jgi:hypothetical protein
MIYIRNTRIRIAKSEIYLGNAGLNLLLDIYLDVDMNRAPLDDFLPHRHGVMGFVAQIL